MVQEIRERPRVSPPLNNSSKKKGRLTELSNMRGLAQVRAVGIRTPLAQAWLKVYRLKTAWSFSLKGD